MNLNQILSRLPIKGVSATDGNADYLVKYNQAGLLSLTTNDIPKLDLSKLPDITKTTSVYGYQNYLAAATKSVDNAIIGKTPSAGYVFNGVLNTGGTMGLFNEGANFTNGTGFTRNASLWCASWNAYLSCFSPWNSYAQSYQGGTLVTPKHIVLANHFSGPQPDPGNTTLPNGTQFLFVGASGTSYLRSLTGLTRIGSTDITIGTLDSDLPSDVIPAFIGPPNDGVFPVGTPVIYSNKNKEIHIGEVSYYSIGYINPAQAANRVPWTTGQINQSSTTGPAFVGDSGSPVFIIINDRPCLMFLFHFAQGGDSILQHVSDINAILPTGYSLKVSNINVLPLSNFFVTNSSQNVTGDNYFSGYNAFPGINEAIDDAPWLVNRDDGSANFAFGLVSMDGSGIVRAQGFSGDGHSLVNVPPPPLSTYVKGTLTGGSPVRVRSDLSGLECFSSTAAAGGSYYTATGNFTAVSNCFYYIDSIYYNYGGTTVTLPTASTNTNDTIIMMFVDPQMISSTGTAYQYFSVNNNGTTETLTYAVAGVIYRVMQTGSSTYGWVRELIPFISTAPVSQKIVNSANAVFATTIQAGTNIAAISQQLTHVNKLTLPFAAGYTQSRPLFITDTNAYSSATNYVTVVPSSGDTVNGATSAVTVLTGAGATIAFPDGTSNWRIVRLANVDGLPINPSSVTTTGTVLAQNFEIKNPSNTSYDIVLGNDAGGSLVVYFPAAGANALGSIRASTISLTGGGNSYGPIGFVYNNSYVSGRVTASANGIQISNANGNGDGSLNAGNIVASAGLTLTATTLPSNGTPGELWSDGTHVYCYLGGTWKQLDN